MTVVQPYPFDPELAAAIPLLPVLDVGDLAAARAVEERLLAAVPAPDTSGVHIEDSTVAGPDGNAVPIRLYRPAGQPGRPAGALLSLHSGGFILGSLEVPHARNVELARELGVVVVAPSYRLAPENPFPAGLEDCYATLRWLAGEAAVLGVDADRIAVMGSSAGGGLAAALALLTRDRGGPSLCFQFLAIPALDDRMTSGSMSRFTDTPLWNRPNAVVSWDAYLGAGVPGGEHVPPYAAPARATDLTGLPPAYVAVMHFDPLRDEGLAYAAQLLAADVPVELHLFPGTFHGSTLLTHAAVTQRELAEQVTVLRRVFAPAPAGT